MLKIFLLVWDNAEKAGEYSSIKWKASVNSTMPLAFAWGNFY